MNIFGGGGGGAGEGGLSRRALASDRHGRGPSIVPVEQVYGATVVPVILFWCDWNPLY